jgi:hypothetical protein
MPTTTELIAIGGWQVGLVLLIDGIATGFTDHADLVGISTGASHSVILGLQRDGLSCKLAINMRDGQWLDSPASVTIVDYSTGGDLADLFLPLSTTEQSLGDVPIGAGLPVHPSTDLTGRPDLDLQNVGLERIGINGARHQYAVPPGFDVGLEHTITNPALDIEGAPVSSSPIVWIGRRAALYMVFRDHVDYPDRDSGAVSWRPFSESRRLWCGTIRGPGKVSGREWTFELDGPDSLLRKPLAAGFSSNPVRIASDVTLVTSGDTRDDGMLVRLTTGLESFGIREWVTSITGTTTDDIRDDVIAEIAATAAAAGTDGVWEDQAGYTVGMDSEGTIRISVDSGVTGPSSIAIGLSRKVWSLLGYNVEEQAALYPDWSENRAVDFVGPLDPALYGCPGPDYWIGFFYASDDLTSSASDGSTKTYRPMYLGGTTVLLAQLNEGRGQVIRLDTAAIGGDGASVAHPGQLARPVASDSNNPANPIQVDGVDCNRCGLWLFRGKRRYAGTEEVFDETWIGFANWTNGSAQEDNLVSRNLIIVTRWLDPALFGYETKGGIDDNWVARDESDPDEGQISAVPLVMLGYRWGEDKAHIVLQRLLHSTGTSTGWDSYENDDPTLDAGDNEPVIVLDGQRRDAEIADLGLAIPDEWIASPAAFAVEADRIENASILDVKVAFTAGYQAEDVIRSLMMAAGWAWHFRDGQFGIWCPADPLTLADATIVLDRTVRVEKQRKAGQVRLRQELQKWSPVDKWTVSSNWQPFERKVKTTVERRAPDAQFRYRPGETKMAIQAHAMRGDGNGLLERLLHLSRWFALPHFEVQQYPLEAIRPGLDVWPGTIVRLTDPELLDPATGYGVNNRIAIVTSTTRTFGDDELRMVVDLLVLGTRTSTPRVHAPIAKSNGYDSATGRLFLSDDWASVGNGWADANAFVEPSYSGITAIGGNAVIEVWQWDGSSWSQTFSGTVTSRVATVGAAYLVLSSTSGTYYRDMDSWVILRPSTVAQAAWVESIFSPIASNAGVWTDDAAASQDVLPWE